MLIFKEGSFSPLTIFHSKVKHYKQKETATSERAEDPWETDIRLKNKVADHFASPVLISNLC